MIAKQEALFPTINTARYGDGRRRQSLFLPKYLERKAFYELTRDDTLTSAHDIIKKWADLEVSGKLQEQNETTIEGEFISEIFGKALGYTLFSDNKKSWNIKPKYPVNGGIADAAIGLFAQGYENSPVAIIELKGPTTNLDRDRFNGRTAVQQCWDYLNALPQCTWGIVSNYVSFRIYHRSHTPRTFDLFVLQDLCILENFLQFYFIFEKAGLLPVTSGQIPRALHLLEETNEQKRKVGDDLYKHYHDNRLRLIDHLSKEPYKMPLDKAIKITQKLLDRIIFVAFCQDRGLLPKNSIADAYSKLAPFTRVTNPKWQNFLDLFHSIDKGNKERHIPPYNGGLFKKDDEVDNLNLDDSWTDFFRNIGSYDFKDEVNVDVLGHLFERSINDIEKVRLTGVLEIENSENNKPKMEKSAERKRSGVFYTPPQFTSFIVDNTVLKMIEEKFIEITKQLKLESDSLNQSKQSKELAAYWRKCLEALRNIKIVDPACGSGAFLISAYELLEDKYIEVIDNLSFHEGPQSREVIEQVTDWILHDNLFGVDLSQEAVEITQLALWIRTARDGKTLADLSENIMQGNSLIDDLQVHPKALNWEKAFPHIFAREEKGFDCVIGNPPWERLNLKNREFFAFSAPHIIRTVNAAESRRLIEDLKTSNPDLYEKYVLAKNNAETAIIYVRDSKKYPLTSQGDINTYAVFAELAYRIVSPHGRVGLLVPSGIATDNTNRDFFGKLIDSKALVGLFDFENRHKHFADVDGRFKFCVLLFGGSRRHFDKANFVFFAHEMDDLKVKNKQIRLSPGDFKLLNPNTRTCPVFRTRRDVDLTKSIYKKIPILVDESRDSGGNPWGIRYMLMFHQSFDASLFQNPKALQKKGFKLKGNYWVKGKNKCLPLYEAKMIQAYDHRAASVIIDKENWARQGQTVETSLAEHQNPEHLVLPRWWVSISEVDTKLKGFDTSRLIAFKNVSSPTNQRTMISAFMPYCGVIHSAPLILIDNQIGAKTACCLLANLNSMVYDFVCRQKIGGINLSYYIINQIPTFAPAFYADHCPWSRRQKLEKWISDRVLKLTCTSNDMIPVAKAAGFDPPVYRWKPEERIDLIAQLDAAFFILYGIKRDDVEYILSTFSGIQKEEDDFFISPDAYTLILKHYDDLTEKAKALR